MQILTGRNGSFRVILLASAMLLIASASAILIASAIIIRVNWISLDRGCSCKSVQSSLTECPVVKGSVFPGFRVGPTSLG